MKGSTISTVVAIAALVVITLAFSFVGSIKPNVAALVVTAFAGLGGYP